MKNLFAKIREIIDRMFPQLPTDNLYKFLFIGSLTVVIFLYGSIDKRTREFKDRSFDIDLKLLEIALKDEVLSEDFLFIDSVFKTNGNVNLKKYAEEKFIDSEIEKKALDKEVVKINRLIDRFDSDRTELLKVNRWCWIGVVIFGVIAVFSSALWYHRVQKYEDQLLKNKL